MGAELSQRGNFRPQTALALAPSLQLQLDPIGALKPASKSATARVEFICSVSGGLAGLT